LAAWIRTNFSGASSALIRAGTPTAGSEHIFSNASSACRRTFELPSCSALIRAGTAAVATGNLDYRISETRRDEIGNLARDFNRMTADLKTVTASRDELEREILNRQKLERELKDSEEKYRNLFSSMGEGFALHEIILDADGKPCDYRFLEINHAFEQLTGISGRSAVGRTIREIMPEIEDFWIETYGRVALTGEPARFENYSAPLAKWFELYAYSPAGKQFAVIFQDITQRKKAEETIRESERKFRIVADFTHDWEYWMDPQYGFIYMSPSCKLFTGYDRREFMENPGLYTKIVHPDDRAAFEKHLKSELQYPDGEEIEFRIVRKDGQERWISHVCRTVRDEKGNNLGRRCSNRDITQSKRADEQLRRSRADLAHAQLVGNIGNWRLDVHSNRLIWSEEAYRIFGIPAGTELTYQTFLSCVYPADRRFVDESWQAALKGAEYDIEHRILRGEEIRWVREKAELEFDSKGNLLGGFGITQDITDKKNTQQELARYRDHLEDLVAERTRSLIEKRAEMENLIESNADAMLIVDQKGVVKLANPAARSLLGQEIKGRAFG